LAETATWQPTPIRGLIVSMGDIQSIVDRVTALIEVGHHRDEVPRFPGEATDGGGVFSRGCRLYYRGSTQFADAAARGMLDRLPPPPGPATPEQVAEAEALLGAPLPPLLRALYAVANGGFGPAYGLLGLRDGWRDDLRRTGVDIVGDVSAGRWPGIPAGMLPLAHWGCAIYSFVSCPTGRMFGWDPNPVDGDEEVPLFEQDYTIDTWFEAWLDSTLLQPWLIYDPERGYRGATIAETRAAMTDEA